MHPIRQRFTAALFIVLFHSPSLFADSTAKNTTCVPGALRASLDSKENRPLYSAIESTDLGFIRDEARFAEGPAPQRNVTLLGPEGQFRFNDETAAILELKSRLIARYRDRIIQVQRGHKNDILEAVAEQFGKMLQEFPVNWPKQFRRDGDTLRNLMTDEAISLADIKKIKDPVLALEKLGRMVPDDLIFMKKNDRTGEFELIGGNLASPTHWSIGRVLGDSILAIHGNIGKTTAERDAFSAMINRVCDRMIQNPQNVARRNNWFLELDPRYALPDYLSSKYPLPKKIDHKNYGKVVFLRSERQTLRGLPESKTVVFTILPFVYPLERVLQEKTVATELLEGIKVKLLPQAGNAEYVPRVAKYLQKDLTPESVKVLQSSRVNDTSHLIRVEKPARFNAKPGDAVRVIVHGPQGEEFRTLSLASSPERDYLEFAVRDSESDFKKTFQSLRAGDRISVDLAHGQLHFDPAKPAVMIAGGIGITPFRGIIQYAKDRNLEAPMWLFYGNRDQIPFERELNRASAENAKLNVTHVLSKPDAAWKGARGRIDDAFLSETVPTLPNDAIYYIVGPPSMINDTRQSLVGLGIPDERINIEVFPETKSPAPREEMSKAPDHQTICYCHKVAAGALRQAIRDGASTLAELKSQTKAATGCGGCECNVMSLLQCEMRGK